MEEFQNKLCTGIYEFKYSFASCSIYHLFIPNSYSKNLSSFFVLVFILLCFQGEVSYSNVALSNGRFSPGCMGGIVRSFASFSQFHLLA